ncbi:FAD-dependent oxidoreductase [Alkaliphilus peptidifermentans]|uniref:Glycine/D-amino acid oxidase n=1 Tax=Alkaliphilus peptidifermentans DSM 18978 TaxID=1120976 RepID=A0A1G5FAK2_9FIRM|nr:FAD-dependent oxidoreductase [Alkaliphilus peptidifermentans]SCY36276.1 Glycine/D-amino acid oxidase [Alkaliphilus peptidifermentans DSM 18978]
MDNHINSIKIPQSPEPYWRASVKTQSFEPLTQDITTDVAIVGGGITGIISAYLLLQEGFKVTLIDASNILNGTTAHTTAKITAQHDLIYAELINHIGKEKAKLYYTANTNAIKFYANIIKNNNIDCDYDKQDSFVYTSSDKYINKIDQEVKAYQQLGIRGDYVESLPVPINIKAAAVMRDQSQFHPLKFLNHLLEFIVNNDGHIFEETTAVDIVADDGLKVITKNGANISCKNVIIASHFPFYGIKGLYFSRMYPDRSYVLGVKTKIGYPGGMYLSADDPKRSLRYTNINGEKLVLIGGENHVTGKDKETSEHYYALKTFGEDIFGLEEILYRWSTQDLTTLDNIPYIGRLTSNTPNIFVATGYRKWGMTTSALAALLLKDLIMDKSNPYTEVFSPSRFHADPSIKNYIKFNANVAKKFVAGRFKDPFRTVESLKKDEGSIVSVNGKRVGAYRDPDGELHLVSNTCPHLGCMLKWNHGERTWDCPCHGSRFSIDGDIIEGPAEKELKK